jgi:hypothetical protein
MKETNNVPPTIRKELLGQDITNLESWDSGGAKAQFKSVLDYSVVKSLNDEGYVVGGIFIDGDDKATAYIEDKL